MSNSQLENLKGQHHPIHAFYVAPPAGLVLSSDVTPEPKKVVVATTTTSSASIKPSSTTVLKTHTAIIPNYHPTHYYSNNIHHSNSASFSASASSMPSSFISTNRKSPPLINNVDDSSFNDKTPTDRENADELPWLAPLLGVLGTLGVVAIAIIYLIGRDKKKKRKIAAAAITDNKKDGSSSPSSRRHNQQATLPNSYTSWDSLSTINTSVAPNGEEEKKLHHHYQQPPPAYTSIRQKRLTADTLVDENNTNSLSLMLKNQYSPQLAFSPILVVGEFQQQQLEETRPSLSTISPSNTLIDNAGVLSGALTNNMTENYHYSFDQRPKKIEIYEPQVNLHDDDNPFIPYSYSNDGEEERQKEEEQQQDHTVAHHIVNMNNKL